METTNEKETTTVALSISDNQRLTELCKAYSIPKKDFIGIILNYIEINGINPKTHYAPKTELEKITKRINQLFAFIKTQEKDYTRPALEAILATENRMQNSISTLATKKDLNELRVKDLLNQLLKILSESNQEQANKILYELKSFQENTVNHLEEIKKKKGFSL